MRAAWSVVGWAMLSGLLLYGLHRPVSGFFKIGPLMDPRDGLYRTARKAHHPAHAVRFVNGLGAPVTVERDARGVPHIFAENYWDALAALGYVVAQDRLFQMDFVHRVAAGRLAEIFGPESVAVDRFLRSTGMARAAQKFARDVQADNGLELQIIRAFGRGVNAYIGQLDEADLPFEFRLFDSRPAPYSALHAALLIQYFNFDLSYETDDVAFGLLRERLGEAAFARLYPSHAPLSVPIVPTARQSGIQASSPVLPVRMVASAPAVRPPLALTEGFRPGKGSNSWVVSGAHSTTRRPLLAGDMHLDLTLPSIWYEAHLVTPDLNLYGVVSPGAPLLIEGFSNAVGWAFTNMGADAIDFYALELDASGRHYRFDHTWRELIPLVDTIRVRGAAPVVDTLWYSHMGPLWHTADRAPLAMRWAAHETNHTLSALWYLARAQNVNQADSALQYWGTPAQNVLLADTAGNIAVRSAGYVPQLEHGGSRAGILPGHTSATQWSGRLPHALMPFAKNPVQGYLAASNQQPTTTDYPHYLGYNWPSSFRSLRLESLLSGKQAHSLADMRAYQRDVHVVQRDLLAPHLARLGALPPSAAQLRDMLVTWDGVATIDRTEPLVLHILLQSLQDLTWDEPAFFGLPQPRMATLLALLSEGSPWFDVERTTVVEDAQGVLRMALIASADTLHARYGKDPARWRWGAHHKLTIPHLTQSPALRALWSDTYEYPGFDQTVSPAEGLDVRMSASWRMIVDFSEESPRGYGVYPGGQSGNPFSKLYDLHMETYTNFGYYDLRKPTGPSQLDAASILLLQPASKSY